MVFESSVKEEARSEEAEALSELVNDKNIATKTDIPRVFQQTVFEMVGFDMLSDAQKQKLLNSAYDRPKDSPITIGDYFMAFAHFYKVNAISGKRKSREEYVRALGGVAESKLRAAAAMVKQAVTS